MRSWLARLAAVGLALAAQAGGATRADASAGRAAASLLQTDDPARRWEFFLEQRRSPGLEGLGGRLQAARSAVLRRPMRITPPGRRSAVLSGAWEPLGPQVIPWFLASTGRVSAVTLHPTDPDLIFAGGAQGGVWRTDNQGRSWRPLTDDQCSLAMGAIALDPVDPEIVYAGTGEAHFSADSYYGCGVLRSTDGGATWAHLGQSVFGDSPYGGARISRMAVDPATAGSASATTVYAATDWGFYRSTNSGRTWHETFVLEDQWWGPAVTDLALHPSVPERLFIGVRYVGVHRSTNGGATWKHLTLGDSTDGRIMLAQAPSDPAVLYAAFDPRADEDAPPKLYRSSDGGDTWSALPAEGASCTQCWYDMTLAVHPRDPSVLYFGSILFYRSDNGGRSFDYKMNGGTEWIHVDQHVITTDPERPDMVWVGNDGGVYRSPDRGEHWESLNTNLELTQFYGGVSISPRGAFDVLGGTQDNGTVRHRPGDPVWEHVLGGDGGFTATHPTRDRIWVETQWGGEYSGPRRSDGGASAEQFIAGIDLDEDALFIPPLVMDAFDPDVLYFGTSRLYKTRDGGDSWQVVPGDIAQKDADEPISRIAPARSDGGVVYVASWGKVHVTRDGGATWRTSFLPDRFVSDLAVHPTRAGTAWATVSGFGTGHVFATDDFGDTWRDITGNLPDHPVNAVLLDPANDDQLFVGTDLGVFASAGPGRWTRFGSGLPMVAVFDLVAEPHAGMMVAATHGRGAFSVPASAPLSLHVRVRDQELEVPVGGQPVALRTGVGVFGAGWPSEQWTATHGGSEWLSLDVASGFAFDTLAWTVDPSELEAGEYEETVRLSSASVPREDGPAVVVGLTVGVVVWARDRSGGHAVSVTGVAEALGDSVVVEMKGFGAEASMWSARTGGTNGFDWLELLDSTGTAGDRLRWRRRARATAPGLYVDTIRIDVDGGAGRPFFVADTFQVATDLSVQEAARALLGDGPVTDLQRAALDRLGNHDGAYNLGDFLSWRDRCRAGGARCKDGPSSSAPATLSSSRTGPKSRERRLPGRNARRRSAKTSATRRRECPCECDRAEPKVAAPVALRPRTKSTTLGLRLLASALAAACGGDSPPTAPDPIPTTMVLSPSAFVLEAIDDAQQLGVQVRDQNGNLMAGAAVAWTSSAPDVATVDDTGLVRAVGSGAAAITARAGAARAQAAATVRQTPRDLQKVEGDRQDGVAGDPLDVSPTVRVLDANGHPAQEAVVRFAVTSGGGSISPDSVVTEADGLARTTWTLGSDSSQTLVASAAGLTAEFAAVALPLPGFLTVDLTLPNSNDDAGVMLEVEGPGLDSLRATDFELFHAGTPLRRRIVVAGRLRTGGVLEFWVPNVAHADGYQVRLLEVAAAQSYEQRDLEGYGVVVRRED